MSAPLTADRAGLVDEVVGVELTVYGMLVTAYHLRPVDFPVAPRIRPNISQEDLRELVWDQAQPDLTAHGALDRDARPHSAVAAIVDTLGGADPTGERRWWRRDNDGVMARFVLCRKDELQSVGGRAGDLLVLQLVAPEVGLAGMGNAVPGPAVAAKSVDSQLGRVESLSRRVQGEVKESFLSGIQN